jgi:hypothetical protein
LCQTPAGNLISSEMCLQSRERESGSGRERTCVCVFFLSALSNGVWKRWATVVAETGFEEKKNSRLL